MDDIESSLSSAFNSISSTGAPAVIAGVENYAAQQLTTAANTNQAASQAAVKAAIASGQPATGVLASIENSFKGIAQGTFFQQYGLYVVAGIVVIAIVAKKVL